MNSPSEKIPCIVFAHLGKAKPKHLWLNIERTHAIFPSAEIHFISDRINDIPKQIRNAEIY